MNKGGEEEIELHDKIQNDEEQQVHIDSINDSLVLQIKKTTTCAVWRSALGLAQVMKLRGNFWRTHGFTINGTNFLYPEEMICLFERQKLVISSQDIDHNSLDALLYMNKKELYETALQVISMPCLLAYSKLKGMEYIVTRHHKTIHCYTNEKELQDYLMKNPSRSLLDAMVSYDLYIDEIKYSKTTAKDLKPLSYVVITSQAQLFSSKVLLALLDEAQGVPIIFAIVMASGYVLFEEFTDAEKTIPLTNANR